MPTLTVYRLRAGSPQPSVGVQRGELNFVLQTFGAEKAETVQCQDKTQLLTTLDMEGQGGDYRSASYQGTNLKDESGTSTFQATEETIPEFIQEEDIPNIGVMFILP